MQKCENCKSQFSWHKIYKSLWWGYKPINCNECGMAHKITTSGRFVFVSLTILPAMIFGNFLSPFNNFFATFGIALFILLLGSLLLPFFVTFKKSL
ncbi:TIGR04104 family putative zinc finger protein [Ornithinibacillus californiensis]|uniref:TIGR04104 family putative zinc finger protein n=1 Tax=Ornithinibacillus californiensis TaxID=161536 RepID=UPI00064DD401